MNCDYTLGYCHNGKSRFINNKTDCDHYTLTVTDTGNRRTVVITAKEDISLLYYKEKGVFGETPIEKDDLFLMNGYQSWTDTKETYISEKEHNLKKLPRRLIDAFSFDRYGDYTFYDYDKNILHGYDVFYKKGKNCAFIGSVNNKNAYLIIELNRKSGEITLTGDVKGKDLKAGESFTLCDYVYGDNIEKTLEFYKEFFSAKPYKKFFGYTSWYNYYEDINEEIILRDLSALDSRFNLFQIDDGFETAVGDWLSVDNEKFPNGLSGIVSAVHKKGFMAGIWLAPFVAEEKSRLFSEKQDWFCKDEKGEPIKCGSNWSGFYALDLQNIEVRNYIKGCLKVYADMGFDFFKLDFLYGANLPAYKGKTRCEAAEFAYNLLREALPDKLILGCGATTINAAEKFDYLRIGPDVSLSFNDVFYMRFMHRERVSTKVTLQNTIYRSFMNGLFFGNDPDVFLLRDDNISLTAEQKKALITINALFGSVLMTSDNIADYDEDKKATLDRTLSLFKNGKVTSFERDKNKINISYMIDGESHKITYNTESGVLI
ncbi:MAG: alpha-galactosidase [Clostridia bacterium]|nr:alpha-galactosidase [Clostridia bacterium]